jgi:HAD superfamily hydrolase (TIGR01450 family)
MRPQAFLFDMDGVLFHGDRALPGAGDFLEAIQGLPHAFVTNNPILTPEQVAGKLERMGLPRPDPRFVLTSAEATAAWLALEKPCFRYFAVGADGLHRALAERGVSDPQAAEFVVVGEGPGLDYATLSVGINLILKKGARLVVTNPDLTVDAVCGGEHCVLPGGGALVAPFAAATGVQPVVIGKPAPGLFLMALERLARPARACVMVGDRPDTDIAGAAALGMMTALVRTGRFQPGEPWPAGVPRPLWDLASLGALAEALERSWPGLLSDRSQLPRCRV